MSDEKVCGVGSRSCQVKLRLRPQEEPIVVFLDDGGEGAEEKVGAPLYLCLEQVRYYPPVFDFLLSQFPHTMSLLFEGNLPQRLKKQIEGRIEFSSLDWEDAFTMLHQEESEGLLLEGVFLPPRPGTYQFRIVLVVGGREFVIEEGERTIIAPREGERWTQGPLVIPIADGLFLSNLAAAASGRFLAGRILPPLQSHEGGVAQIAVLNAAEEREIRPALFSGEVEGVRFVYRQFAFTDFSHNPMAKEKVWDAVKWIHEQLRAGPVVVHCHAGIGRSSSLIVAYLRLFTRRHQTYDEVVEMMKTTVRKEQHDIFPHVGLPETLTALQEDERCQQELSELLHTGKYDYRAEPTGRIESVSFARGYAVGQKRDLRVGETIVIQSRVEYEGDGPCGVFVHTNLVGHETQVLMQPIGKRLYQAEIKAPCQGENFWLTVSATLRRYEHPVKRCWVGGDLYLDVR